MAESGALRIVNKDAHWVEPFLLELENFDGENRNLKDDQCDAVSDAFATLSKQIQLPTFALPTLDRPSPIPTL
jgi:phage terminase large subunit-like protein